MSLTSSAVLRILALFVVVLVSSCDGGGSHARGDKSPVSASPPDSVSSSPGSAANDVTVPKKVPIVEVKPTDVLQLDAKKGAVAASGGVLFVRSGHDLFKIDAVTSRVIWRQEVPGGYGDIAVGFGSVWLGDFSGNKVRRFSGDSGKLQATVAVRDNPSGMVAARDAVWVAQHRGGSITRVDPTSNRAHGRTRIGTAGTSGPSEVATDGKSVFISVPNEKRVVQVSTSTAKVVRAMGPSQDYAFPCGPMTIVDTAVWVTGCFETDWVSRLDFGSGDEMSVGPFGAFLGEGVAAQDVVWFATYYPGGSNGGPSVSGLTALDAQSGKVLVRVPIRGGGYSATEAEGSLWIVGFGSGRLIRFDLAALTAAVPNS